MPYFCRMVETSLKASSAPSTSAATTRPSEVMVASDGGASASSMWANTQRATTAGWTGNAACVRGGNRWRSCSYWCATRWRSGAASGTETAAPMAAMVLRRPRGGCSLCACATGWSYG